MSDHTKDIIRLTSAYTRKAKWHRTANVPNCSYYLSHWKIKTILKNGMGDYQNTKLYFSFKLMKYFWLHLLAFSNHSTLSGIESILYIIELKFGSCFPTPLLEIVSVPLWALISLLWTSIKVIQGMLYTIHVWPFRNQLQNLNAICFFSSHIGCRVLWNYWVVHL